jgi:hypothetical protein
MVPVIKGLNSSDIYDLESYIPENKECFGFPLTIKAGPQNENGSDYFNLYVCTSKYFENELLKNNRIVNGRHFLFVEKYNYAEIISYINDLLPQCESVNWQECAVKLGRYAHWEYEDYKGID